MTETQTRPTLKDLAGEDWRIQSKPEMDEASIARPSDRPGFWIGPILEMDMDTYEDEDGDAVLDLANVEGRNLYAFVCLPQFARLVTWTLDELEKLNGIHFDSSNEAGRFHRELRNRCGWIQDLIDDRDLSMGEGDYVLADFDRMLTEKERIR